MRTIGNHYQIREKYAKFVWDIITPSTVEYLYRTCTSVVHGNDEVLHLRRYMHFGRFRHLSSPPSLQEHARGYLKECILTRQTPRIGKIKREREEKKKLYYKTSSIDRVLLFLLKVRGEIRNLAEGKKEKSKHG